MDLEIDASLQESAIIHVGFPKCASKTLQNLFSVHESLTYINNRYTFELLILQHPFQWNGARARNAFTQLLAQSREMGTVPVISDERLLGHPHSGFYDTVDIAHRLHALMPRARVLICIREQISMLASMYKQAVKEGCTRNVKDYLLAPWDWGRPHFYWEFYQYCRIIELYQALFGKNRVRIMLMEQLRDMPENFYKDLYAFLSVEPCPAIDIHQVYHAGMSDLETAQRRLQNFFSTEPKGIRDPNPFDGLPINRTLKEAIDQVCSEMTAELVPSIEAEVRTLFEGRFAASNRELSDRIGIDLAAFGYEIAPETAPSAEAPIDNEAEERFEIQPVLAGDAYLAHNIVKYRGVLFALPWTLGHVDIREMSPQEQDGYPHDRELNCLKRKIEAAVQINEAPTSSDVSDLTSHAAELASADAGVNTECSQPDSLPAQAETAKSLFAAGRFAESIPLLQQLAALQPDDAKVRNLLGQAMMQTGRLEEARCVLLEAVALAPHWEVIPNNLAALHWQQGDIRQAVEWMQRARQLAPQDQEIAANSAALRQSLVRWAMILTESEQ